MPAAKPFLMSRTVWANAIGLLALLLAMLGFDTTGLDRDLIAEQALQAVAAASFVFSTLFRVVATRRIG